MTQGQSLHSTALLKAQTGLMRPRKQELWLIVSLAHGQNSQAGLVSCLEPWKNTSYHYSKSSGYRANLSGHGAMTFVR